MTLKTTLRAGFSSLALVTAFATSALAGDIMIDDPYARASGMSAKAGAAFFTIMNHTDADDRLVSATSDIAKRVELHTHKDMGDGVMKMMEVEEGFAIPAGGSHVLQRGGDHVMFMGLNGAMEHGATVSVTLTFETAGDVVVEIPVDLERKPMKGMGHGKMDHGKMKDGKMEKMDK